MGETECRIIKRYTNRKLYDTRDSRYVTLEQIGEMIRHSEEVKIVDNNTKEDLTSVTLAQIIFEEEKRQRSFLPLVTLRNIIQSGGASFHELMNQISGSAERVGRVFKADIAEKKEGEEKTLSSGSEKIELAKSVRDFMESMQRAVEDWQKRLDANIHQAIESLSPLAPIQKEIQTLAERITEIEQRLSKIENLNLMERNE